MFDHFWKKNYSWKEDYFFYKVIFFFLCTFEVFYSRIFQKIFFYKKNHQLAFSAVLPVISVGNISCGGTGKSVVVMYLLNLLNSKRGAILTRGYRGLHEKRHTSLIIDQSNKNNTEMLKVAGDEAFMFAQIFDVPVVVGKNRITSILLLEQYQLSCEKVCDFIILDDAYQYFALRKDFEILLLDARKPFENMHCLPAGLLREKNISRAHCIICTHAEKLTALEQLELKKMLSSKIEHQAIFFGSYCTTDVLDIFNRPVKREALSNFSLIACAGIGSFSGFRDTLHDVGIGPVLHFEYADHYDYSLADVNDLKKAVLNYQNGAVITTRKDWYKIKNLWLTLPVAERFPIFCLDIQFRFCNEVDEKNFFETLKQHVNL